MGKFEDLTGRTYGRLTVISRSNDKKSAGGKPRTAYECQCRCGNTAVVARTSLVQGSTKSCGCLNGETKAERLRSQKYGLKHGDAGTRLWSIWFHMRQRCTYKNDPKKASNYSGRGIAVCDEWQDYSAFKEWATQNGYDPNLSWHECTIERVDNGKGYSPSNCRFANMHEQNRNKRDNHFVTYSGKTQTVTDWAEELGINRNTLYGRLKRYGGDANTAFNKPVSRHISISNWSARHS